MRRHEKEITEKDEIQTIIDESIVLRLGLSLNDNPYVVPVCFGYDGRCFYIHGAVEGKKIDILKTNNRVSFELDTDAEIIMNDEACNWSMKYKSIIGSGNAAVLSNDDEKKEGLRIIMEHYSDKDFEFSEKSVRATAVIRIEVDELKAKCSGFR